MNNQLPTTINEVIEPKTEETLDAIRDEYRALDNALDQYRVVQAAFERDGGSSMSAKELKAWGEARGFAPGHIETVGREFRIHQSRSIEALRKDIEDNYKKEFDRIREGRNRGGSAGALNRDIDRITIARLSLQGDLVYAVEKALSEGKRVSDEVIDEFLKYGGKLPGLTLKPMKGCK